MYTYTYTIHCTALYCNKVNNEDMQGAPVSATLLSTWNYSPLFAAVIPIMEVFNGDKMDGVGIAFSVREERRWFGKVLEP